MRLPSIPAGMQVTAWPPVLATVGPGWRGALHSHHSLHFVRDEWVRNAARALDVTLPPPRRTIHPRVRRLLASLRSGGVRDATSRDAPARSAPLSSSRLMHVFTASVGIPLRPYLAWLRLQRAATTIVNGSSLGDAAHAAGFADAAQMSRTFRRMLGVAPSSLRPLRCLE